MFQKRSDKLLIGALLVCYVCIQTYCIYQLTPNYDESLFATYGATILKFEGNKDIKKFDSKLPITAVNMLPRAVEQIFHPGLHRTKGYADIIHGRFISLLVAILLALLVYRWSEELYGQRAAILSFLFFLLCPNFLAHGIFVSSDIFACFFMTAAFYSLWKFSNSNRLADFIACSVAVAMCLISKFSMLHLEILVPAMLFFCVWRRRTLSKLSRVAIFLRLMLMFAFIGWFVVSAAHLFYGMFEPIANFSFRSDAMQQIQRFFPGAWGNLPVPFPSSYIKSLDAVIYFDHLGGGMHGSLNGATYLLGKNNPRGFPYYYFVVMLFKLAISTLILIAIATITLVKQQSRSRFFQDEIFLLLPTVYFLIYLNFFYSTQVGIRHIMIILPLLYIFMGRVAIAINRSLLRWAAPVLLLFQFISVALYFPHFLPYTNEFIPNKKLAYQKLADTNLCYGEGGWYLEQYLKKHPEAKYLPDNVVSGTVVMEVNEMLNLNIATIGCYDWVRGLEPAGDIHSQYLIFNISRDRADSIRRQKIQ